LGINGGVKTLVLKQTIQVPQGDFFLSQAGFDVAECLLKVFDFAVPS